MNACGRHVLASPSRASGTCPRPEFGLSWQSQILLTRQKWFVKSWFDVEGHDGQREGQREAPERIHAGTLIRDPDPTAVLWYCMHGLTFSSSCFEAFSNSCFAYLLHAPVFVVSGFLLVYVTCTQGLPCQNCKLTTQYMVAKIMLGTVSMAEES